MRWLVENWHGLLAGPWDAITLVLLALGGRRLDGGYAGAALGLVLLTWAMLNVVRRTKHGDSRDACESTVSFVINPDHGKASIKLDHLLAVFSVPGRAV